MSITVTIADQEGNTATFQIAASDTTEKLKSMVEAQMQIPSAEQALLKDGTPLRPGATLTASGVVDNDFLFLVRDRSNATTTTTTTTTPAPSFSATAASASMTATAPLPTAATNAGGVPVLRSLNDLPPNCPPEEMIRLLNANPRVLKELEHHNSELAKVIATGDVVKVRTLLMKQKLASVAARVEQQQAMDALEANPMDPEAQRKIEEMIQKENVLRNMEMAMEEMPEAFGSVVMLYVDVEVNGHPIKAFVDSGAQSTIMSAACATRCGLSRLIDTRFAGIAKGVGTSKILGRIHMHTLRVGEAHLPCTFTVLENDDVDFLFGLDMLKRHQCCIDLKRSVLVLGSAGKEVAFLAEKDLPARARGHHADMDVEDGKLSPEEQAMAGGGNGGSNGGKGGSATGGATATATAGNTGSAAAGGSGVSEAGVEQLMQLGFSRQQATSGLMRTGDNVDEAAALLLAEFGGP